MNIHERRHSWPQKFRVAVCGALLALGMQSSFQVQLVAAAAVVALGAFLEVSRTEWCILTLAIGVVLSAEAFNTSLEHLARAISDEHHEEIRRALDVSAGAVLIAAVAAAAGGGMVFLNRLATWIGL